MNKYGFLKICTAVPRVKVANPAYNGEEMLRLFNLAEEKGADLVAFPELSVTGYSCGDLFLTEQLLQGAQKALHRFAGATKGKKTLAVVGIPLLVQGALYNCAAVIQNGKVCGVVPKTCIANQEGKAEGRWFTAGGAVKQTEIDFLGDTIPFGNILFKGETFSFGIEIAEDALSLSSPAFATASAGADLIVNLSATLGVVSQSAYLTDMVKSRSALLCSAYAFVSAGPSESTTDGLYPGYAILAETGKVLYHTRPDTFESSLTFGEIDIEQIRVVKKRNPFMQNGHTPFCVTIQTPAITDIPIERQISPFPFIPEEGDKEARFAETYRILTMSVAKRLAHTGVKTAVIGVSGGLDSTLALLILAKAMDMLGRPRQDVVALTMPGFGTTSKTLDNAKKLMEYLDTTHREISIKEACLQHFKDIGHNPENRDVTYENTQARERTQILMDVANQTGGLVIGTGDLSELALGWATFAGDHISMYGVNGGVPKTLIRPFVQWLGDTYFPSSVAEVVTSVIKTPVSPELLPAKDGEIAQKTEDILGDYALHDFFLYYFIRYGFSTEKIGFLAKNAFAGLYTEETISGALSLFIKRFFGNQFKRSCLPDGPKIGTVTLSPRGGFIMPSDVGGAFWQK